MKNHKAACESESGSLDYDVVSLQVGVGVIVKIALANPLPLVYVSSIGNYLPPFEFLVR